MPRLPRLLRSVVICLLIAFIAAPAAAQKKKHRSAEMQYGPHQFMTLRVPGGKTQYAYKGCVIKVGENAYVCFDTELLRYAAAWTGDMIDFKGVSYDGGHGGAPQPGGPVAWSTSFMPGVANAEGKFDDPRPHKPYGPLPREWAKYKGLYHHGENVILSYTIGDAAVLEMPGYGQNVFSRMVQLAASTQTVTLVLFDVEGGQGKMDGLAAVVEKGDKLTAAGVVSMPPNAKLRIDGGRVLLDVPPRAHTSQFIIRIAALDKAALPDFQHSLTMKAKMSPLDTLTKGGPRNWTETVTVAGILGDAADPKKKPDPKAVKQPYVVDTIPVPFDNPYKSWMRTGGFDFFKDAPGHQSTTAAVTTWSGDVWLVKGVDDKLEKIEWSRFACGIHDGLGLKIVGNIIYTHGREGITRLHDLNGDGEADYYENFNNDVYVTHGFHEFQYELHTDAEGHFYFVKGGSVRPGGSGFETVTPHDGCAFKLSKDGTKLEVIAAGLRAPNGMGVGPNGEITTGDNEGTWVPKCRINYWTRESLGKKLGFGGVVDLSQQKEKPAIYDPPICWMPKNVCNSGGGQTWVTSDRWGPFKGDLLYASYGTCTLYKVLKEEVETPDGKIPQGGVVKFPLKFESGTCRLRFNERDGQLYVMGIRGWQSSAGKDGSFQRVRFTGSPVQLPTSMKATKSGVAITFTDKLDKETAEDVGSYSVEHWNYRWTGGYGSKDYTVSDPKKEGRDKLIIKSAKLASDGRTVFLAIEGITPVMQMNIKYSLEADSGEPVKGDIWNTINVLGPDGSLAGK